MVVTVVVGVEVFAVGSIVAVVVVVLGNCCWGV